MRHITRNRKLLKSKMTGQLVCNVRLGHSVHNSHLKQTCLGKWSLEFLCHYLGFTCGVIKSLKSILILCLHGQVWLKELSSARCFNIRWCMGARLSSMTCKCGVSEYLRASRNLVHLPLFIFGVLMSGGAKILFNWSIWRYSNTIVRCTITMWYWLNAWIPWWTQLYS